MKRELHLDFHKIELENKNFELYELQCNGERIGKFLHDERETHNSILSLKSGLQLNPDLLREISCEVNYEFGNIDFVLGYDI